MMMMMMIPEWKISYFRNNLGCLLLNFP